MPPFAAIRDQAMKLPDDERAQLAEELLSSVEPIDGELQPGELSAPQMREIDRRLAEYHAGTEKAVDAFEALENVATELDRRQP